MSYMKGVRYLVKYSSSRVHLNSPSDGVEGKGSHMYPFLEQSVQEHFRAAVGRSLWPLGSKYSKRYRPQWQLPLRTVPPVSESGVDDFGLGNDSLKLGVDDELLMMIR